MLNDRSLWKNPGMRLSILLLVLWIGSWLLFLGWKSESRMAGLPVFAWSQMVLSTLGVLLTLVAIPWFDKWEKR